MVLNDRQIKVREIANIMGISNDQVHLIIHEELQMKKLSARWVPHLLTVEQKRIRMNISQACLDRFKRKKDFKRRFITVDETWIRHYIQRQKNNPNSGLKLEEVSQRRKQQFNRLVRLWQLNVQIREKRPGLQHKK
uniref:Uncharacterized protein n=1 Tax=Musca domestica TaxID=7370 RepID=A0A1I8NKG9_MUSDO